MKQLTWKKIRFYLGEAIALLIFAAIGFLPAMGLLFFALSFICIIPSIPVMIVNGVFDTTWLVPVEWFWSWCGQLVGCSGGGGLGYSGGAHPIIAGGNIIMMP